MSEIVKQFYGTTKEGVAVNEYTIKNNKGHYIKLIDYGATVTHIWVYDTDVCLGYDNIEGYQKGTAYYGATIGRVANRIANGQFEFNNKKYYTDKNDGNNTLHGGFNAIDKRVWTGEIVPNGVAFTITDPDGTGGFEGNVEITVTYTFDDEDCMGITFDATSDKATPINLTNHAYFNLNGAGNGDILSHTATLLSTHIVAIDNECTPTGELVPTKGTPFDFSQPKTIGKDINNTQNLQIKNGGGYDHTFVFSNPDYQLTKIATVTGDISNITLTCITDYPSYQLYTGNMMNPDTGKNNLPYDYRYAFCIETQYYPDAVNHSNFINKTIDNTQKYHHTAKYIFTKNS